MFAMVYTRADIAFALGRLSQFMKEPTEKHGYALKRLMRYLRSTVNYCLCFSTKGRVNLELYSDADWATDKCDRKSISGGIGMLCGAAIVWLIFFLNHFVFSLIAMTLTSGLVGSKSQWPHPQLKQNTLLRQLWQNWDSGWPKSWKTWNTLSK